MCLSLLEHYKKLIICASIRKNKKYVQELFQHYQNTFQNINHMIIFLRIFKKNSEFKKLKNKFQTSEKYPVFYIFFEDLKNIFINFDY